VLVAIMRMRSPLPAAVDHAHQHHHAHVVVEPAVDDHGARRAVGVAARRRHAGDHGFEDLVMPMPVLAEQGMASVASMPITSSISALGVVGVGLRQVHLVEHRHHFHAQVERGVAVGHRLRLHALAGVDHQQARLRRPTASGSPRREVHVAGRVDQVEVVDLPSRPCTQRSGLRLDGDAALALDVHRVEHLRFHLAVLRPPQRWMMRSASVLLPWSMWAMMEKLRM
jgi:hypothetical protein